MLKKLWLPVALVLLFLLGSWVATRVDAGSPDPIEPVDSSIYPVLVEPDNRFNSTYDTENPGAAAAVPPGMEKRYLWNRQESGYETLAERFPAPEGFKRQQVKPGSFHEWLRFLPLRKPGTPVKAFDGRMILPGSDPRLAAVIDWDIGTQDLQQCADSVIRLRAEWAYQRSPKSAIAFHFTSGDLSSWYKWHNGYRPLVMGNLVRFVKRAQPDDGYANFRRYLTHTFRYAGTISLKKESYKAWIDEGHPVYFIQAGSPGHVVFVLDMALASENKKFALLLGQGFMPAQDFHIITSPNGDPWHYYTGSLRKLKTHFWTFNVYEDSRRFPEIPNLPE